MGLLPLHSPRESGGFLAGRHAAGDRGAAQGEEGEVAALPAVADEVFHPLRGALVVQGIGEERHRIFHPDVDWFFFRAAAKA